MHWTYGMARSSLQLPIAGGFTRSRGFSAHKSLPEGAIVDLMKMDIEGGETALMAGDLGWLERIAFIITELHPPMVNCEEIVAAVVPQGMIHHAPGSLFPESMDMFERRL